MAAQPDDQGEPARPWRISTGGCESWVLPRHLASSQPAEGASRVPLGEETPVVERAVPSPVADPSGLSLVADPVLKAAH